MKIAIVSESPADEAALKILIGAILGEDIEIIPTPLRPGGWPHVVKLLPTILKALHYQSDVDCLAVVVDSDDSPIHVTDTESRPCQASCRLCELQSLMSQTLDHVTAIHGRSRIGTATGLAVPAIEAWYRCGVDPHVNENTWGRRLAGERITYDRRSLKVAVYGLDSPGLTMSIGIAESSALRLSAILDLLCMLFPIGFGSFMSNIRRWSA